MGKIGMCQAADGLIGRTPVRFPHDSGWILEGPLVSCKPPPNLRSAGERVGKEGHGYDLWTSFLPRVLWGLSSWGG